MGPFGDSVAGEDLSLLMYNQDSMYTLATKRRDGSHHAFVYCDCLVKETAAFSIAAIQFEAGAGQTIGTGRNDSSGSHIHEHVTAHQSTRISSIVFRTGNALHRLSHKGNKSISRFC